MKLRQPSLGTNAAIFLPFLISCTRAHLRMAELGCLASMPLCFFVLLGEFGIGIQWLVSAVTMWGFLRGEGEWN